MKICFRIRDRSKSDQNSFKYKLSKLKQILSFFDLELETIRIQKRNKINLNQPLKIKCKPGIGKLLGTGLSK